MWVDVSAAKLQGASDDVDSCAENLHQSRKILVLLTRRMRRDVFCQAQLKFTASIAREHLIIPLEDAEEARVTHQSVSGGEDRGWLEDIVRAKPQMFTVLKGWRNVHDVHAEASKLIGVVNDKRWGRGRGEGESGPATIWLKQPVNWNRIEVQSWLRQNDLGALSYLLQEADGTTLQQLVNEWKLESQLMASAFWHSVRVGQQTDQSSVDGRNVASADGPNGINSLFLFLKFKMALQSLYDMS